MTKMMELVAIETGAAELVDFGPATDAQRIEWLQFIEEANDFAVSEGYDATEYRMVEADTRNCPKGSHDLGHHATKCLLTQWHWENLGQ